MASTEFECKTQCAKVAVSRQQEVVMGKRKLSYRPKKRSRRYFGQSAAAAAVPNGDSESEASEDEGPVSAAKRKLDVEFPSWIIGDSLSSGESDSVPYSNPDSSVDAEYSSASGDDHGSACSSELDSRDGDSASVSEAGSDDGSELACRGYRLVDMECL